MMQRLAAGLGAIALGIAMAGCSVVGGKAAEEPDFTVVEEDGAFQIRAYDAITIARTTVAGDDRSDAVSTGFGRLFDYIQGANTGREKIAMTAPVFTEPGQGGLAAGDGGETIAMTAPVVTEPSLSGWTTIFVLPAGMTVDTAPVPRDPSVVIDRIPARKVAVARFSGVLGSDGIAEARAELAAWLDARGLAHRGDWQAAGYNPPWTLPMYRRNEVLVTLAGE